VALLFTSQVKDRKFGEIMFLFDWLYTIFYILAVIILVILAIVLAIPVGILVGLYYLIFVKILKIGKRKKHKEDN
jgi:hypothetical protein